MLQDLEVNGFFSELSSRLTEARAGDRRRCETFFETLNARLDIARSTEIALDRQFAGRFNVFDFVDKSEIGLSWLIAYLLHDGSQGQGTLFLPPPPRSTAPSHDGSHGQGTLFLQTLLKGLDRESWGLEGCGISTATEHHAAGRRIDILVEISGSSGRRCLAIENKPYADDQPGQVEAYLKYLDKKYGPDFLLVYLSAGGEAPSESSFPRERLTPFASRFTILPYVRRERQDEDDGFDCARSGDYSLAGWFADCRKQCEVDRLRWFLRDGERFCQRQFGAEIMSTDSEMQQVDEFLRSNPIHMRTALTVVNAWPQIRDKVIEDFNDALFSQIERRVKGDRDLTDVQLLRLWEKRNWGLALSRSVWRAKHGRRAQVTLLSENSGLDSWFFGVRQATTTEGEKLAGTLLDALGHKSGGDANWNWWRWTDYSDWNAHIPQLFEELQHKVGDTVVGGKIMAHHVDAFVDVLMKAVSILDDFERDGPADG